MNRVIVAAAAVFFIGLARAAPAETSGDERGNEVGATDQKLLGTWKGQTGCDGRLVLRSDGTYTLTGFGPGHYDCAGTWKVRRNAAPATLVLTCTASGLPDVVGKTTEVKLIQLDDKSLAVKRASPEVDRFARVKK